MKNFVHIIPTLQAGGAETQLSNLVLYDKKKGLNPKVVVLSKQNTPITDLLIDQGVDLKQLDFKRFNAIFSFFALVLIFFKLRTNKHVVAVWMYHSMLLSCILRLINFRIKLIWMVRRTAIPSGLTGFISRLAALFSYCVPDKIVCNSNAGVNTHILAGYSRKKMLCIPNVINTAKFNCVDINSKKFKSDLGIPVGMKIIGVVGRYAPVKGHLELLKALAMVKTDYCCIFVGRDIKSAPPIAKFLDQNKGMMKKLLFLGERQDIPQLMALFDFLVLPSLSEGFPNVVAESMVSNTPCIVTDVGDAAKIVENTGVVVKANDIQNLASAIDHWLVSEKEYLLELGGLAHTRILENYSAENVAVKYHELLKGA